MAVEGGLEQQAEFIEGHEQVLGLLAGVKHPGRVILQLFPEGDDLLGQDMAEVRADKALGPIEILHGLEGVDGAHVEEPHFGQGGCSQAVSRQGGESAGRLLVVLQRLHLLVLGGLEIAQNDVDLGALVFRTDEPGQAGRFIHVLAGLVVLVQGQVQGRQAPVGAHLDVLGIEIPGDLETVEKILLRLVVLAPDTGDITQGAVDFGRQHGDTQLGGNGQAVLAPFLRLVQVLQFEGQQG